MSAAAETSPPLTRLKRNCARQFWIGWGFVCWGLFHIIRLLLAPSAAAEPAWTIGVEMESDTASFAQLFYDRGAGYRQEDSSVVPVQIGRNRLLFTVRGRSLAKFRFDPLDGAGRVTIRRMWDGDVSGKESREMAHLAFKPENQIATSERHDNALVVTTTPAANDPMLSFDLGHPIQGPTPPAAGRWSFWVPLIVMGAGFMFLYRRSARAFGADDWGMLTVVAAFAVLLLYGLHRTLDVPIWDEANYLGAGRRALHGDFGPLDGAATYHAWYALLLQFAPDERAVFANHYVLKLLLPLLATLATRRWFGSWLAGALVGAAVAASAWDLAFPLLVYQAAWVWWLAALATVDRSRWLALGFAGLAALTRLEYAFPCLAALGLVAFATWRGRGKAKSVEPTPTARWKRLVPVGVVWAGVLFLATRITDWNPGAARSWFAFQQHYAVAASARGELPGENPWLAYPKLIARDFPGVSSLREAFAHAPGKVAGHVADNLALAPHELGTFFTPATETGALGMAVLFALAAILAARRPQSSMREWFSAHRWSLALAAVGLLATAPGLIIYAKTCYLLPAVPVCWLAFALLGTWFAGLRPARTELTVSLGALAIGLWCATAVQSPFNRNIAMRPVATTLATIRTETRAPIRLLGVSASSYAHYLGEDAVGIEPLASVTGRDDSGGARTLPALVERHHATAVLVNADWRNSGEFDAAGPAALAAAGWRPFAVPGGMLLLQPFQPEAGRSQ